MTRTLADRAISSARAAWYASTEPARLQWARSACPEWVFIPGDGDVSKWRFGDPLVTVYIPTHNRAELLFERALPSVQAQTYRNLEIIVAAHGGNALQLSASFVELPYLWKVIEVPRIIHWRPSSENVWRAGPVDPCNAALKTARGDWIMRLDDDDVLEPDAVEKLLRFAQSGDYEFVSAGHDTHEGSVKPYLVHGNQVGGVQTWLYRSYLRFFRYNRDCWRKSWNCVNDCDLQDRMARAGVRMGYLSEIVAHVRPRPGETKIGLAAVREKEYAAHRLGF